MPLQNVYTVIAYVQYTAGDCIFQFLKKRKFFFAYYFSAIAGKPFDARHTDFYNESKNEWG